MKLRKNIAVSDSGFLFNPSTGDSYSVNPIGQFILQLLQEGKKEEEIIRKVTDGYMVDQATVEKKTSTISEAMLKNYKLTE